MVARTRKLLHLRVFFSLFWTFPSEPRFVAVTDDELAALARTFQDLALRSIVDGRKSQTAIDKVITKFYFSVTRHSC